MANFTRQKWELEEIENFKTLCKEGKHTFKEMSKILDRAVYDLRCKRRELNIKNTHHPSIIYSHNQNFFSHLTPKNCYWAALIATDGHIGWREKAPFMTWGLTVKDKVMLENFREDIGATNPIKHRFSVCKIAKDKTTKHEQCYIYMNNVRQMVLDLERHFGITQNKTLRSTLPVLPSLYHKLCYIRGFIDGDGMITCAAQSQKGFIKIGVCGCNKEMIAWVKETIDSMNLPRRKGKRPSLLLQDPGIGCYYFNVRGFKAAVLFELLRRLPVHNLSRKWDNPIILEEIEHWKCQKDIWPPETYFENLLRDAQKTISESSEILPTTGVSLLC